MNKLQSIISLSNKKSIFEAIIFFFFVILVFLIYTNIIATVIPFFKFPKVSMDRAKIISEIFSDLFKISLAITILVKKRQFSGLLNLVLSFIAILIIWISDYVIGFMIISYLTTLKNKSNRINQI